MKEIIMLLKNLVTLFIVLFLFKGNPLNASTYYVCPKGNDSNPGSEDLPWKTINYAMSKNSSVSAGDTVLLREGTYNETVSIAKNGTIGKPITLKNYERERPVLDGSKPIEKWKLCTNRAEVLDNPNWRYIYITTISTDKPLSKLTLFENGKFLNIAQWPNQTENVLQNKYEYEILENESYNMTDSLVDSSYLTQTDDYWNGSWIYLWSHSANNMIIEKTINDFIASEHKIVFDTPLNYPITGSYSTPDAYSIVNHLMLLDQPGEYFYKQIDSTTYQIYLWPLDSNNINNNKITYGFHEVGIISVVNNISYVIIEGLEIRCFATQKDGRSGGIHVPAGHVHSNLIIQNNYIHEVGGTGGIYVFSGTNDIIKNNRIENVRYGFGIGSGSANLVIDKNEIICTERTGIYLAGCKKGIISYNTVAKSGAHGNGIATYLSCSDILIACNKVINANIAYTMLSSHNVVLYNNLFIGNTSPLIGDWGEMTGYVRIINNTIQGSSSHSLYLKSPNSAEEVVTMNNIIDGGYGGVRENNIYTLLMWNQTSRYGWQLGTGEICNTSKETIFEDYMTGDFHLREKSIAINSGRNIDQYLPKEIFPEFNFDIDIEGKPRVQGDQIDIGPYEYSETISNIQKTLETIVFNGTVTCKVGKEVTTATHFISGTTVELTAIPNSGYRFGGWAGDASGTDASITITMDSNKTVTAICEPNPTGGQVFHAPLDDGSGSTITDANNLHTGNLINGPLWGAGWRDEDWLRFNQSTQAITLPTMGLSPQAGTIAVWVAPTDFSGMKFIFGHVLNNANRLSLYTVAGSLAAGLGSNATLKTNITNLSLNQPVHLALSWNGTAYAVYVNGLQKAAGTFGGLTALNTFIDIGNYGDPAFRSLGFAGKIDDIRTYNRALAAEEIDALYLTQDVRQGKDLQFTVNAVNAQGIPIVYQAAAMPAGASFDAATQLVTWTPWHNQLGLHTFRFTAAGQAEKRVTVEVHPSSMTSWYSSGQEQLTKVR